MPRESHTRHQADARNERRVPGGPLGQAAVFALLSLRRRAPGLARAEAERRLDEVLNRIDNPSLVAVARALGCGSPTRPALRQHFLGSLDIDKEKRHER